MKSVDDAQAAVTQAQEALAAASTVLSDVESESTVDNVVVTGITVHYSNGVTAEFSLDQPSGEEPRITDEELEANRPINADDSADSSATDSATPAADPGESSAPEIPVSGGVAAGTIPE